MKYILPFALLLFIGVYGCKTKSPSVTTTFTKGDLEKLRWLEGAWKGLDGVRPFYEHYTITNDSTLHITSYDWNGADSSNTTTTAIAWKQNHYFLGDSLNWRVDAITHNTVFLIPNYKAANKIIWKKKNQNTWEAVLTSPKGVKIYQMERVAHFAPASK
jgi:hypothetical protein